MKVSVILPTFNEVGNIVNLVREILKNMPEKWVPEIIVVDDNSPDGTYEKVKIAFKSDRRIVPILRVKDKGFAKSIREGIDCATGDQIMVMDTDFTHDPTEIPKMLHVSLVYDLVSGSRFCPGGNMGSKRHYIASLLFNWIIRVILRTQIQDNLGGFFTLPKSELKKLPLDKIFYGYGEYYFRLLHYAQRAKLSIVETPSYYHDRHSGSSKSNFLSMLFIYSRALIKLRLECWWEDYHNSKRF